jgi:hypothetical protein
MDLHNLSFSILYPGAPPHIRRKKRKKPAARYLIDQYGEKGKAI